MPSAAVLGWALVGVALSLALRPVVVRYVAMTEPVAVPPPYGALEAPTAVVFAALAHRFGPSLELLAYSSLGGIGVPLGAVDVIARKLPNILLAAAYVALGAVLCVDAAVNDHGSDLVRAAIAMAAAAAIHGILYVARAVAGGDLKLAGLLGAALGWSSWNAVWMGLAMGWLIGGLVVGALRILGRQIGRDIPLGPFLLAGALLWLLGFGASTVSS